MCGAFIRIDTYRRYSINTGWMTDGDRSCEVGFPCSHLTFTTHDLSPSAIHPVFIR